MKIKKTAQEGVYKISYFKFSDMRGFFTKIYSSKNFKKFNVKQVNISKSIKKGTFRGLHFQKGKHAEQKIIFCLQGKIIDFIVDLNKKSKTYLKVFKYEIDSKKNNGLLISNSYAHGFLTLEKNTTVVYLHDREYHKESEGCIRFNDPLLNIEFPIKISIISDRDLNCPDFKK
tara:strand:- start:28062 stop:28580 length:519 start_codon:yes stop_codon:yes gene_type:complete